MGPDTSGVITDAEKKKLDVLRQEVAVYQQNAVL